MISCTASSFCLSAEELKGSDWRRDCARKLNNVRLHPYQPRERLSALLGISGHPFVSLMPDLEGLIVPSKFYGIAAAARPAIFIGSRQGEIAQLVDEAQCGITIEPGDNAGLLRLHSRVGRGSRAPRYHGGSSPRAFDAQWEKRHGMRAMARDHRCGFRWRTLGQLEGSASSAED